MSMQKKTGEDCIKDLLHIRNRLLYINKNCNLGGGAAHNLVSSSIVNAGRIKQLTQDRERQRQIIAQLEEQNALLRQAIQSVEKRLNDIIGEIAHRPQHDGEGDSLEDGAGETPSSPVGAEGKRSSTTSSHGKGNAETVPESRKIKT